MPVDRKEAVHVYESQRRLTCRRLPNPCDDVDGGANLDALDGDTGFHTRMNGKLVVNCKQ